MKKSRVAVAFLAILGLGIAAKSVVLAAPTATVDIVLTMSDLQVSNVGAPSISMNAGPNQKVVLDRGVFRNLGATNETYQLHIATGTNWTLITSTNPLGVNQYRLGALWHQWDVKPSTAEFAANDTLTMTDKSSSATVFFNDTETHATVSVRGDSVPVNEDRSLFVLFETPAIGSTPSETNRVTVTAIIP